MPKIINFALMMIAGSAVYAQNAKPDLYGAIYANDAAKVKAAIKAGADANQMNWSGPALATAATSGYANSVRALVESGANVNLKSPAGWNALMGAADNGHLDIVKYLVSQKADIHAVTKQGRTALIRAAYHGQTAVIQYLLSQGAKVNHADNNGVTALMLAAQQGHDKTVKVLLDAGADKKLQANTRQGANKTALDLALTRQTELDSYKATPKELEPITRTIALLKEAPKKSLGKLVGKVFSADGKKLVITGKGIADLSVGQKLKIKTSGGEIAATVKEVLHSKVKATAAKAGAEKGDAVHLEK